MADIKHTVKKGEKLIEIAKKYKVKDWKEVWDHAANKVLVQKRKKPEALESNDILWIPQPEAVAMEPMYVVTYKGKQYALAKPERTKFEESMLREIRRGPLLAAQIRVSAARTLWDHFKAINNDQFIVSWLIEATRGVDLPSESVITQAESALKTIEAAVAAKKFDAIDKAFRAGEPVINKTINVMDAYRKNMISGGENWVTGLEVTKTVSFTIVSAYATGGMSTGAAIATAGGFGALEAAAGEVGKLSAGDSSQTAGSAAFNIVKETIAGAVGQGVEKLLTSAKFAKLLGPIAEKSIAHPKVIEVLGGNAAKWGQQQMADFLVGAGSEMFSTAVKEILGGIKDGSLTVDKFTDELVKAMWQGPLKKKLGNFVS